MKTSLEAIKQLNPCKEGLKWYEKTFGEGEYLVSDITNKLINDKETDWANWFVVRCMTHLQKVEYAVFAAEQVIDIFEKQYPKDDRPRKAIEAAKAYLKDQSDENGKVANEAAYKAHEVAYAADATAYAVVHAAYAAAYAADDEIKTKIIRYGLSLLDGDGGER